MIWPSIKLVVLLILTLAPTTYALVPWVWFTVNALEPVPIKNDVVEVKFA